MMKKRPTPSDGDRAELVVPKKRKSARLLASKDNDKQTATSESTGAGTTASKEAIGTPKDAGSSSSDSSPNNNCSICLGHLENKSFTDSCFHTFCFVCLLEWSKVKAVCPLCKQPFKSIIHNVRSIEDYDQYYLRSDELTSDDSRRFRYRTTLMPGMRRRHEEQRHRMLLQRPSRAIMRGPFGRTGQAATSEFRQRIYATGMRVKELVPTDGRPSRYRDISAAFFARNPASTHRVVPWLNRELNVLLNHHDDHIQFVLELILDLIKRYDIRSEEFFQHIQPFTGRRTEHFIHEFYSFARAPYDIVAYDQNAAYDNVDLPVHEIESDDDATNDVGDDDDSDVIMVSPPPGEAASDMCLMSLTPLLNRVRNFLGTFSQQADTAHTGWDTPVAGTSHSWSPQYTATRPDDPIDITDSTTHQNASGTPVSSAGSDLEIVAVEKPWESRTPICLSSDSDCGVTMPARRHRSRSLSSTRSSRTGHSSRRRRSRSSSRMLLRNIRNRDRHRRRHGDSSRRRSRERRDRRRDMDRSSSSRRKHRDRDGRKERYRDEGHGRSHHSSGRRSERRSHERHLTSLSRSHIYVDSDSSHSSHRHKRRHKDRRDRGTRRERRRHDDDEVQVTPVHPLYKRSMDGDVSNDVSSERRYKKHPTGHKHSKPADEDADDDKLRATVKKEKDTTAVLKSIVVQPSGDGESVFVPVAVREEPQNDGYADYQEPSTSDAQSNVRNEETEAVDKHQEPGTSDAGNTVENEEVPDAQPSTTEFVLHKECPSTEENPETEPSIKPVDVNNTANVTGCADGHNVEPSGCERDNQTVPTKEPGRDALEAIDAPPTGQSSDVADQDDRVEVESEESSIVDVESIDPSTSGFHQQLGTAATCLSVSDDDDDVQVVDTGSSNDVSVVALTYLGGQINVTSSSGSSSDSNSSDSSSRKDHLSIDITSPNKEYRSEGSGTEPCISITDDDEDSGQCSPAKKSCVNAGGGSICQGVVSVSNDDNTACRNMQSGTTDSMSGDFNGASGEEAEQQLQQLKAALAANNNMNSGGTGSTELVEQLKQLLPKNRHRKKTTTEQFTAGFIQEGSLSDNPPKQCHSALGGDDNVDTAKETSDRGDQSSAIPNQKKSTAEYNTTGIVQQINLSWKSLQQCPSAKEANYAATDEQDVLSGVRTGGYENRKVSSLLPPVFDKGCRTNGLGDDASEIDDHVKEPMSTVHLDDSVQLNKSGDAGKPADTSSTFEQLGVSGITSEISGTNSEQGNDSSTDNSDEILRRDVTTYDSDNDDEFAELYLEHMQHMN